MHHAGGTNLGNYCYLNKVGIFAEEYAHLRAAWSKKGGDRCLELGHGIHDPTHPELVKKGLNNWGEWTLLEAKGIFDRINPKLADGGYDNFGEWSHDNFHGIFERTNPKLVDGGYNNFGEWSCDNNRAIFDPKFDGQRKDWRIKGGKTSGKDDRDNRRGLIGEKMDEFEKNLVAYLPFCRKVCSFHCESYCSRLHVESNKILLQRRTVVFFQKVICMIPCLPRTLGDINTRRWSRMHTPMKR